MDLHGRAAAVVDTLGCFVHFHVIVPDGVFRADDAGAVVFREGPAPTRADIAARVEKRMRRWLRRRGLLDERAAEDRSNEAPDLSPLEACMQMSLFGSTYVRLAKDGAPAPLAGEEARFRVAGKGPWVAEASGFNVHAGVMVRAGDREGLERLCRYGARPPFSLERLSILADGRVAYLLRKAIVADISDSEVVVAILAHLGLPTEAPPIARARSPGFDFT